MTLIEVILTAVVVLIILVLFYMYMNWARDQYLDYNSGKNRVISSYVPPVWMRAAWDPTWREIQRLRVTLAI